LSHGKTPQNVLAQLLIGIHGLLGETLLKKANNIKQDSGIKLRSFEVSATVPCVDNALI
jgi:hypothetical protein